jgi:hypothetical protein
VPDKLERGKKDAEKASDKEETTEFEASDKKENTDEAPEVKEDCKRKILARQSSRVKLLKSNRETKVIPKANPHRDFGDIWV